MKITLLFVFLSIQIVVIAQQPGLEWLKLYGAPGDRDLPVHIDTDLEGYVYLGATLSTDHPGPKIRLAKYSATGTLIWSKIYTPDFDYQGLSVRGMDVDSIGNIVMLVHTSNKETPYSLPVMLTVKFNSSGTQLWSVVEAVSNFTLGSRAMTVDKSGNVYVCGAIGHFPQSVYDYIVFKYNKNGSKLWGAIYNGPVNGNDEPYAIAVDNTGNVFVTGEAEHLSGTTNVTRLTTVKYSGAGFFQWQKNYASASYVGRVKGIKTDNSGNAYVLATLGSGSSIDPVFYLAKYSPSGTLSWSKNLQAAFSHESGWTLDAAGNCYLAHMKYGTGAKNVDISTHKFDPSGLELWNKTYDGGDSTIDMPADLALDATGNVYVTGRTSTVQQTTFLFEGKPKITTLKYSATGTQTWVVNYIGPKTDPYAVGTYITLHGAGSKPAVYLAGNTASVLEGGNPDPSMKDVMLLKYDQTGKGLSSTLETPALAQGYKLSAAPNPFSNNTTIRFEIPYDAMVSLKIYDVTGREVGTLVNGSRKAGLYQAVFNAGRLPSQQYFYTLKLATTKGEVKETKPLLLSR